MAKHSADDPNSQSVGNKDDSKRGRGKAEGQPRKVDPPPNKKRSEDQRDKK
jgi:hypothetical protein